MIHFGLLLFPNITQLDLTGPYEVFAKCTDAKVDLLWKTRDPVASERGMAILPSATFAEVGHVDVLCIPGGAGINTLLRDRETINYVRQLAGSAHYVTSVCTGALLLGAAGFLQGKRATTHWSAHEILSVFGATPVAERVVQDGNLLTGSGVTAGIDFALQLAAILYGEEVAQGIQLTLEYNPQPPFNAGHPSQAPKAVVEKVTALVAARTEERWQLAREAASLLK